MAHSTNTVEDYSVVALLIVLALLTVLIKLFSKPRQSHTRQSHTRQSHTRQSHTRQSHTRQSHTRQSHTTQEDWSRSSSTSHSYIFSPGTPLTPSRLRKISLLSSISTTVSLGDRFTINSVGEDGQDIIFQGYYNN
jgi:cytoskeletal protein RodZ